MFPSLLLLLVLHTVKSGCSSHSLLCPLFTFFPLFVLVCFYPNCSLIWSLVHTHTYEDSVSGNSRPVVMRLMMYLKVLVIESFDPSMMMFPVSLFPVFVGGKHVFVMFSA